MAALLAVPNVSEGSDPGRIEALQEAFGGSVLVLDRHSDADHDRTVFTVAGPGRSLAEALVAEAEKALETIDMSTYQGVHPAIGALDVCPMVWTRGEDRDVARSEATEVAAQIGALG